MKSNEGPNLATPYHVPQNSVARLPLPHKIRIVNNGTITRDKAQGHGLTHQTIKIFGNACKQTLSIQYSRTSSTGSTRQYQAEELDSKEPETKFTSTVMVHHTMHDGHCLRLYTIRSTLENNKTTIIHQLESTLYIVLLAAIH